ncbi:MAG: polysaccharide deacetylase family protein [Pyrinomonadaceae bacterium]
MKKFLFALLYSTRLISVIAWLNRKRVPILCYHSVNDGPQPVQPDLYKQAIPLPLFLQHLDYLKSQCHVVSLSEFQKASREKRSLPDYSVVLTFDDGFEDFYTVAAPHLARRKFPATVFVITDRADDQYVSNGESFLSWAEIRELASSGVDIGSHTCSHPYLRDLSPENVAKELRESYAAVQSHTGQTQVPLSYPYGQVSQPISRLAHEIGYSCAIANDVGPNAGDVNLYELSRTVIASDDDIATFSARVSGLTWWISRGRRLLRSERDLSWEPSFSKRYGSAAAQSYLDS